MALTSTRQRNAVSEGMALGLVLCGHASTPFDKVRVDLAFTGAWRGWAWKSRFPQVNTDLAKGLDGAGAMARVTEGKQTLALFWDNGGSELTVRPRQAHWDPADEADLD